MHPIISSITIFNLGIVDIERLLFAAFGAIIFIQSGIDKVANYKGNLGYFKSQFAKSPLSSIVGLLLPVITIMELVAGLLCAIGTVFIIVGRPQMACYGLVIADVDLLCLLFGQRIAQDYVGASGIVPYFIAITIGLSTYL